MEQPSNEIIEKSLYLLNKLYNKEIIGKATYEQILPTLNKKSYNFVLLRNYKNLLAFLSTTHVEKEDLHFMEFFNIEKEKHYQEYMKLFSTYDNYPAFFL